MGTDDMETHSGRSEISVKVTHGGVTKRTSFKVAELTYETLRDWVNASFAFPSPVLAAPGTAGSAAPGGPVSRLVYRDPEGDAVSISSTEELKEALRLLPADADLLALHLSFPRPRERWLRHMMMAGAEGEAPGADFSRRCRFAFPGAPATPAAAEEAEETINDGSATNNGPAHPPHPAGFGFGSGGFGGRCGFGGRPHHLMDHEAWEARREACMARREARREARAAASAAGAATNANCPFMAGAAGDDDFEAPEHPHGAHGPFGPHHGFGFGRHGFGPRGPHHGPMGPGPHHGGPHHGRHGFGFGGRGGFGPQHGGPHNGRHGDFSAHPNAGPHFFGQFHPGAMPPMHHANNNGPCDPWTSFHSAPAPPHADAFDAHGPHHRHPHHAREHFFGRHHRRGGLCSFLFGGGEDHPWSDTSPCRFGDRSFSDRSISILLSIVVFLLVATLLAMNMFHHSKGLPTVLCLITAATAVYARIRHGKAAKRARRAAKRAARIAAHQADKSNNAASSAPSASETTETAPSHPFEFDRRHHHHGRHHARRCARDLMSGEEADIDSTDSSSSSPSPAPSAAAAAAAAATTTTDASTTTANTDFKCRRGGRHHGMGRRCRFAEPSSSEASSGTASASSSAAASETIAPSASASATIEVAAAPAEERMDTFSHWDHRPHHHFGHPHPFGGHHAHPHPHHPRNFGRFTQVDVDGAESPEETTSSEDIEFIRNGMKTLIEMGFTDRRMNRKLLKRFGSVPSVIAVLTRTSADTASPEESKKCGF